MQLKLGVGTGRARPIFEGTGPDPESRETGRAGPGITILKIGTGPYPARLKRASSVRVHGIFFYFFIFKLHSLKKKIAHNRLQFAAQMHRLQFAVCTDCSLAFCNAQIAQIEKKKKKKKSTDCSTALHRLQLHKFAICANLQLHRFNTSKITLHRPTSKYQMNIQNIRNRKSKTSKFQIQNNINMTFSINSKLT